MSARGIEAARAFVRIYAEDSRLKQSLTGIRGQFQRLNSSLSGPAVQAAMAGPVAAGAGVVKVAMDMERVGVAFRVMIGDAEKSQQLLKDIADMARTSPLSIAQYQRAGQTLLQFGMQVGEVLPVLDSLGNIAAGDGEKLSRLALAFGQMQAAGRLMGQDLLQMINAGFNPLQEISERTGESMESLKKRMSEGGVSAAEVTKSFRAATAAGGRFAGMNEEISQTAAGVFATMQSEVYALASPSATCCPRREGCEGCVAGNHCGPEQHAGGACRGGDCCDCIRGGGQVGHDCTRRVFKSSGDCARAQRAEGLGYLSGWSGGGRRSRGSAKRSRRRLHQDDERLPFPDEYHGWRFGWHSKGGRGSWERFGLGGVKAARAAVSSR